MLCFLYGFTVCDIKESNDDVYEEMAEEVYDEEEEEYYEYGDDDWYWDENPDYYDDDYYEDEYWVSLMNENATLHKLLNKGRLKDKIR